MLEFERIKQTIGRRTVLMTSWFDESHQTWRASAPDYAHLSNLLATARVECPSRKAAVDVLIRVLTQHFAALDG